MNYFPARNSMTDPCASAPIIRRIIASQLSKSLQDRILVTNPGRILVESW